MTDITIPPEAFTAAELAYTEALSNGEDPIRAACLAMLRAWPGMTFRERYSGLDDNPSLAEIILNLENPNDKA